MFKNKMDEFYKILLKAEEIIDDEGSLNLEFRQEVAENSLCCAVKSIKLCCFIAGVFTLVAWPILSISFISLFFYVGLITTIANVLLGALTFSLLIRKANDKQQKEGE